ELQGKFDGFAMRVPTINVSVVDLTFTPSKATSVDEVNEIIKKASEGQLKCILGYNTLPLVSVDFNHDPRPSIFDSTQTRVSKDGKLVKILAWYDNEWGYSCQMLNATQALMQAK
ncbi:MAG: erythrose-4-phosphate dehydrogenase, partial [Polynucleobacter victoriensis]